MDPLTVFYIDYGNTETLTGDRLFKVSEHLASKPLYVSIVEKRINSKHPYFNVECVHFC